ncbi:MAG TPA: heavy-metal-associated domain-containing protein, partial [Candidatus Polarisedimenticolaceae bacterium]|nr:heavy-metal-associated domain-containing protein [Candidatus Polarisedimenticolaceae bacterium]
MRKVSLFAIAVLLFAMPAFAGDKDQEKLPEGQTMANISISGMTCGGCCSKVEAAVADLEGVVKVKADYEKKTAMVVYEKDKIDVDQIVEAINTKTSFKAEAGKS